MSDSVRPHRRQPTRLHHPWNSPGKNTGVGCHFLLQCGKVKSESEVAQSCPTLSNPMDYSPPGPPSMGFSRQEYWSGVPLPSLRDRLHTPVLMGFLCDSAGKESASNAGDLGSIPGLERSPGEGNGSPLQYSGLENSMDCIVHGVTESLTGLSNFHFHFHWPKEWKLKTYSPCSAFNP